jgi:hypothetical protein
MDPSKKIRVRILVKQVSDRQDEELKKANGDAYTVLNELRKLLSSMTLLKDEENKDVVLNHLNAAKFANEIMANSYANLNRIDLFNEKVATITAIDDIINQINKI